jgi:integrase
MRQRTFTDSYIRSLKPKDKPYKLSENAPKGEGRMIIKVQPGGTKEFFYRYRIGGTDKTLSLGRFDAAGKTGRTLAQIRTEVHEKRSLQRATGDVKEHLKAEGRQKAVEKRRGTLQQLIDAYIDALTTAGKPSAPQAKGILKRHVTKPFPALADTKASDVTPGDIQRILAKMVKAGITRQVNVVRSYLGAAFAHGAKADHDPRTVAKDGVLFGLKSNPVSVVPRITEYENTGERVLSEEELRLYWSGLDALPVIQAATLRFNLALACQRPTQLLRAGYDKFDFDRGTLLLSDSKGRGGSRDHLIPLTKFALSQFEPIKALNSPMDNPRPLPFSTDGVRPMALETLSTAVRSVSGKLTKDHKTPSFQMRDLRRTAETMLQRLGIDKEVRAHLLSHGRTTGVQGKHYERYDFLDEKLAALNKWARHLERIINPKQGNKVVVLRG